MVQLRAISIPVTKRNQLKKTVELVGRGIVSASEYQPLRLFAAQIAASAPRKNYLRQVKALYDRFMLDWRYVRDPYGVETVVATGKQAWNLVWGKGIKGKGFGDCDDATVALGGAVLGIGIPVRIVTQSRPNTKVQSHVYFEAQIPGTGWVPVDPVAHPIPFGRAAPAGIRIVYNLKGQILGVRNGAAN